MSNVDVARATWRAELLEYTAEGLRAAGFEALADERELAARTTREQALISEQLAVVKAEYQASGKTDEDRDAYNAAKLVLSEARRALRDDGAPRPGIVDNFAEPTADELIELGY